LKEGWVCWVTAQEAAPNPTYMGRLNLYVISQTGNIWRNPMRVVEFEAIPLNRCIPIPEYVPVTDGLPVRVRLIVNAQDMMNDTITHESGSEEVFHLLASLSD
jgi:hypothetical protein